MSSTLGTRSIRAVILERKCHDDCRHLGLSASAQASSASSPRGPAALVEGDEATLLSAQGESASPPDLLTTEYDYPAAQRQQEQHLLVPPPPSPGSAADAALKWQRHLSSPAYDHIGHRRQGDNFHHLPQIKGEDDAAGVFRDPYHSQGVPTPPVQHPSDQAPQPAHSQAGDLVPAVMLPSAPVPPHQVSHELLQSPPPVQHQMNGQHAMPLDPMQMQAGYCDSPPPQQNHNRHHHNELQHISQEQQQQQHVPVQVHVPNTASINRDEANSYLLVDTAAPATTSSTSVSAPVAAPPPPPPASSSPNPAPPSSASVVSSVESDSMLASVSIDLDPSSFGDIDLNIFEQENEGSRQRDANASDESGTGASVRRACDTKLLCSICGDVAINHVHYGGHCCFSCKAFFRRAVNWQNAKKRSFVCKGRSDCEINIKTRKSCQYCRYQKCIQSGLNPSWVLTEDERRQRFRKFHRLVASQNSNSPSSSSSSPQPPTQSSSPSPSSSTGVGSRGGSGRGSGQRAKKSGGAPPSGEQRSSSSREQNANSPDDPQQRQRWQEVEDTEAVLKEIFGEEVLNEAASYGNSSSAPNAQRGQQQQQQQPTHLHHRLQEQEEQEVTFIGQAFDRAMRSEAAEVEALLASSALRDFRLDPTATGSGGVEGGRPDLERRLLLFLVEMASFNLLDSVEQQALLQANLRSACDMAGMVPPSTSEAVSGTRVSFSPREDTGATIGRAKRLLSEANLQQVDLVLLVLVIIFSRDSFSWRQMHQLQDQQQQGGQQQRVGAWTFEGLLWVDQCQLYYFRLLQKHLHSTAPPPPSPPPPSKRRKTQAAAAAEAAAAAAASRPSWASKMMAKLVRVMTLLEETKEEDPGHHSLLGGDLHHYEQQQQQQMLLQPNT